MPRVAIILPTSTYRAKDFMDAAQALDIDITVVSERRQLLADEMGDGFLLTDLSDPAAAANTIVERSQKTPFDAIVAVDDPGVLVAAQAAERLGLPHNPPSAVAATRNKAMLRRALSGVVRQPPFQIAEAGIDATELADFVGYPLVIKPLSLSASRGVIRVDRPEQVGGTVERVRLILARAGRSPSEPLLFERFVPGAEVAVEAVLRQGTLEVLAVMDKPDALDGPYFEESIYVTPSRHHPEILEEVFRVVETAVATLGLVEGPIHAEVRIDGPFVRLIEVAARSIGGLCGRALRFGLMGSSLESVLLRAAVGMRFLRPQRTDPAAGVLMLPIARSGVFNGIDGADDALAVPGIYDLEISVPVGETIEALPEGHRYLGFLFARGDSPAAVEHSLRQGLGAMRIRIDSAPTG